MDVASLLRSVATLSAVNAAEVVDQLVRVWGRNPDDVQADLALLSFSGMRISAARGIGSGSRPVSSVVVGAGRGCGGGGFGGVVGGGLSIWVGRRGVGFRRWVG